jgi:hypothetical protein
VPAPPQTYRQLYPCFPDLQLLRPGGPGGLECPDHAESAEDQSRKGPSHSCGMPEMWKVDSARRGAAHGANALHL